jgi:hypothetical protein
MFAHLSSDQQALATAMSDISEASYSAGWMLGLEFALWHLLVSGKKKHGRYVLSDDARRTLSSLSSKCGGWIVFDLKDGEIFISLEDWQRIFAAEASKHLSRYDD